MPNVVGAFYYLLYCFCCFINFVAHVFGLCFNSTSSIIVLVAILGVHDIVGSYACGIQFDKKKFDGKN